ncbi:MAG: Gfo/Idh/MocA family oxidoreductase [Cyclobacteriaceae bacterium]
MKRREFIKKGSIAASTIPLAFNIPGKAFGLAANDKINIGVIGCKGMGWANTKSMLKSEEVNLLGICDVDSNVIDQRISEYADFRDNKPKRYGDYRKLLKDKNIDAVIVGTPDHWHCKMMVDGVRAGKHVYVEKPVANTIEECNIMMNAAKETGKVVQAGQWQRSGVHYQKAKEIVNSGILGNIRLVKTWAYMGWMNPIPVLPDSPVPDGVDYDFWLGMAPKRPFNQNRFHFNFRWFWDYAGGLMTDWGVHEIDIALWLMNVKSPVSVMASGGKFAYPDDASETPDTLQAVFQYDGFNMLWEHATGIDNGPYDRKEGIAFIGNNATLVVNRGGYEIVLENKLKEGDVKSKLESYDAMSRPKNVNYLDVHTKNFVQAVKQNDHSALNTPIESGSVAAINAQMGNIAYRLGRKVYWDEAKGQFKNDSDANDRIKATYQNGWSISR